MSLPYVQSPHFSLTSATQSFFFAAGFRLLHWNTASSKPWSVSQLLISCTSKEVCVGGLV